MRRRTAIAVTAVVASALLTPAVLWTAGVESANLENRTLSTLPPVEAATFLESDWYRAVGLYAGDRLPLRDVAIRADAFIDFQLAGDSPVAAVTVGEDDWLFLTEAFSEPCAPGVDPHLVAPKLEEMIDVIEASGRRVVFYPAPNKASIYPEYATGIPDAECAGAARETVRTDLENSGSAATSTPGPS